MTQFDSRLFLGFLIDPSLKQKLDLLNPALKSLFIQKNDSYLQEFCFKENAYLGKFIGKNSNFAEIQLIFLNLCSLFKKLVPDHVIDESELMIMPLVEENL